MLANAYDKGLLYRMFVLLGLQADFLFGARSLAPPEATGKEPESAPRAGERYYRFVTELLRNCRLR